MRITSPESSTLSEGIKLVALTAFVFWVVFVGFKLYVKLIILVEQHISQLPL